MLAFVVVLFAAAHADSEQFVGALSEVGSGPHNRHDSSTATVGVCHAFEETRVVAIGNDQHRRLR